MLVRIEVSGVRNLQQAGIDLHADLNIIHGENASGKTSLLEAIAILASGKSFRTASLENVVTHGREQLQVFGKTGDQQRLGYQWGFGKREIRINGESANRVSLLAQALPLQTFVPDTHTEFSRSRRHRIAILDWVLFHVEQSFHDTWSRYQRALAQRNAALKAHQNPEVWNRELVSLAEAITEMRTQALSWLQPHIDALSRAIPGNGEIGIRLKKGWPQDRNLASVLKDDLERDRRDGFTHSGAHRADLEIRFDGHKAREEASQGQLKTLVMVLRLSQLKYFSERTGRRSLFLLDDLPAELDRDRRGQVLAILADIPLQLFLTTTEASLIDTGNWPKGQSVFHVEQGVISAD